MDYYLPKQMKDKPNFIRWKLEPDNKGRQRKIPYSALFNGHASTTNSATWTTYQAAVEKAKNGEFDGVGFVLTKGITFIDLDHCILPDGTLTSLAKNIVDRFSDTFVEVSQSGQGLHIFALGSIPAAVKTREIEMYDTRRFAALTGHALVKKDLQEAQDRIDTLYSFCKKEKKENIKNRLPQGDLQLSEREIIDKATRSKGGSMFADLLAGRWQEYGIGDGSQSSADLRFANSLAYWTGCREEVMASIFRASGMFRNERKMMLALNKAIEDCRCVYKGGGVA